MTDWLKWNGGPCPVGGDMMVEVRCRDGKIVGPYEARRIIWPDYLDGHAVEAYRIVKED